MIITVTLQPHIGTNLSVTLMNPSIITSWAILTPRVIAYIMEITFCNGIFEFEGAGEGFSADGGEIFCDF